MTNLDFERAVMQHPWRAIGLALGAGAILALIPRKLAREVVRTVAFALVRDAAVGFVERPSPAHRTREQDAYS